MSFNPFFTIFLVNTIQDKIKMKHLIRNSFILTLITCVLSQPNTSNQVDLTPKEKLNNLLSQGGRLLETYWESYLSYPFDYNNCYTQTDPNDVDENAYGYDLGSIPIAGNGKEGYNVVNIAFAKPDLYKYEFPLQIKSLAGFA